MDDDLIAGERIFDGDCQHLIAVCLGTNRFMVQKDPQMTTGTVWREHCLHDCQ